MTTRLLAKRVDNLGDLRGATIDETSLPFSPQDLAHVYIKLEFDKRHENASSADDARGFLSSVARASIAAFRLAEHYGGVLLEVQGSMLHVALPNQPGDIRDYAANLHSIYRTVFRSATGRVLGWRLAVDGGRTLVVAGRGVHGDDSYVSLGKSANRPAKHLYAQLDLSEYQRSLKRFWLGVRDPQTDRWQHVDLNSLQPRLEEARSIAEHARGGQPHLEFLEALRTKQEGFTRAAAPIPPAATSTTERPFTYFGWVMRCDLDGFTSRVEECFDDDQQLQELAGQFYAIMDEAKQFVSRHSEILAQLPWAGDNFTAAAVFSSKEHYEQAAQLRLVETSLDFDKEMADAAVDGGFDGWAHGVAGGEIHGNASGNVYLGSVVVGGRRFLVGAGEGFGRSSQAFTDINPQVQDLVLYEPDWQRLDETYRSEFEPALNIRGEQSTLYRVAKAQNLLRKRARKEAVATTTTVTFAQGRRQEVATKPHYR